MANPLSSLGVSDADIERAMNSPDVRAAKIGLAEKAAAYWRSISPSDSGEYIASIHVRVRGDEVAVVADADYAGYLEWGTEDTPEFALRSKTAARFRG